MVAHTSRLVPAAKAMARRSPSGRVVDVLILPNACRDPPEGGRCFRHLFPTVRVEPPLSPRCTAIRHTWDDKRTSSAVSTGPYRRSLARPGDSRAASRKRYGRQDGPNAVP
jgi:hypothetical protein